MRPEEIRALMDQINRPKLAHVLPSEDDRGDDPPVSDGEDIALQARAGS